MSAQTLENLSAAWGVRLFFNDGATGTDVYAANWPVSGEGVTWRVPAGNPPTVGIHDASNAEIIARFQAEIAEITAPPLLGTEPDFAGYVEQNPDLLAAFRASDYPSLELFGRDHWNAWGKNETRGITPYNTGRTIEPAAVAAPTTIPTPTIPPDFVDRIRGTVTEDVLPDPVGSVSQFDDPQRTGANRPTAEQREIDSRRYMTGGAGPSPVAPSGVGIAIVFALVAWAVLSK